ncbi:papain-like cysteine protease family protein [Roseivirga sp. BDSF3-8]|uniref:papain-like cysteine protease family protein n=1 Tax=Roseivirga sp. BDSF3-8 TaxID=3241598 RepID=UPI0035326943
MRNRILALQQEVNTRRQPSGRSMGFSVNYGGRMSRMYQQTPPPTPRTNDEYLYDAIKFFYPDSTLQLAELNDALRGLAAVMIHDALTASRQMDRVPRPTARPTVTWALKQVVRALFVDSSRTGVYESVRATVAASRRSEFELARAGVSMSRFKGRSFNAINYQVAGTVSPLRQPNSMACWATVTTILYNWKMNAGHSIDHVLGTIGQPYLQMFQNGQGLPGSMKEQFLNDAGLEFEYPQSFSIEGWEQLLRNYGPVWVTTDEDPSDKFAIHARVLFGIQGDGTSDGTQMRFVDPANGRVVTESITAFIEKYESEARTKNRPLRIQVVHWPPNASGNGLSGASSYRSRSFSRVRYSRAHQDGVIEMEPLEVSIPSERRDQILLRAGWKKADLSIVVRNFKGEPLLGHRIFAEAKSPGVEPQAYAQDVRGGAAIFNDIWLKPSGTLRIMAVSTGQPGEVPSGVIHYNMGSGDQLRLEADQAYRDVTVTATSSTEAARMAGATGSIGVEFQVFSAGGEVTTEETRTRGESVSRQYTVRIPTASLTIQVK